MTLVELRYIVALAAEGHFGRAAERCSVSQPALSVAIARLESELGVKLFERAKGLVRASEAGALIVRQAQKVIAESERLRELARQGRDQLAGSLRLGVIHTVGPYLLPRLVACLRECAPAMPLVIEENMTVNLATMLREGEIDAAILALPFDAPGIVTIPLYDEPFLVITPRGHAFEKRETLSPDDLGGEDVLLLKAGNCFRDQVLGACPQVSTAESDAHLGFSIGTLRCMVASGLGVSVLPAGAMQPPYDSDLVSVSRFAPPEPSRRIALAARAEFGRPDAISVLARCIGKMESPAFRVIRKAADDAGRGLASHARLG